jgi:glycerol-3-phosphate acyltransferase PlsY
MIWLNILYFLLSALTGYLLGSFLPGYFLPLWVKKMDIREVGDGNPGAINVKRNAGLPLAFYTALYDASKGLLSVFIILSVFKLPLACAYLAGVCAVLGHKFPFYLGFKGGRGIAATVGLFFYIFVKILVQDFSLVETLALFGFIGMYALVLMLATHGKGDLLTVTIFPFLGVVMLLHLRVSADLVLFLVLVIIMTAEAARNLVRDTVHPAPT